MHNEIQYNFDASDISPISPLTKSALIDIAHIFENVLQNNIDYDTFHAPKISVKYINTASEYDLEEFRNYFSVSDDYTSATISICEKRYRLHAALFITSSSIFINLESSELTRAALEDLMLRLVPQIEPYISSAKRLPQLNSKKALSLEKRYQKVCMLPTADKNGNICSANNTRNNTKDNKKQAFSTHETNKKRPFYKSGTFWSAISAITAIVGTFVTIAIYKSWI